MQYKEKLDLKKIAFELWMNESDIRNLVRKGYEIGLHSHTRPFQMSSFNESQQFSEYNTNYNILKKNTGVNPKSMSHTLNSHNKETFKVMKKLNINCSFCSQIKDLDADDNTENKKLTFSRLDTSFLTSGIKFLETNSII